jgi:hypothetical protein
MAELTDEQMGLAYCAYWGEAQPHGDNRNMLRAAAPFLQLPLDEPTKEEWDSIHQSSICQYGDLELIRAVSLGIRQFLLMRNAALLPKVDPRREKVKLLLLEFAGGIIEGRCEAPSSGDYAEFINKILAAIDEVQPC